MATRVRTRAGAGVPGVFGARRVSTPRAVLAVAVLGSSMAFIDASSVNIAVPNIAEHFPDAHLSHVSWVLNAYNIVFAAFLVGGGQLADLLGRRRVFSLALLLFTLASALCAVAPSRAALARDRARGEPRRGAHARGGVVVSCRRAGRRSRSAARRPVDHGIRLAP